MNILMWCEMPYVNHYRSTDTLLFVKTDNKCTISQQEHDERFISIIDVGMITRKYRSIHININLIYRPFPYEGSKVLLEITVASNIETENILMSKFYDFDTDQINLPNVFDLKLKCVLDDKSNSYFGIIEKFIEDIAIEIHHAICGH